MSGQSQIQQIQQSAMNDMLNERKRLFKRWDPFLVAVAKHVKENQGRDMTTFEKTNIAQCLNNALLESGIRGMKSKMFEATYQDNVDFLGIQLPVIAALLPSLVLNEIATVQALDRRQGAVFYLDVKHGTTKGAVTSGDTMIDSKTGRARSEASRQYAMTKVNAEALTNDGYAGGEISGNLAYNSVMLGTITFTDGTEIASDANNPGLLANSAGDVLGWVKQDGSFNVEFTSDPLSAGGATASYFYHYDQAEIASPGSGVPEVNINMSSSHVTALDFPLKAKYSIGASIDLQKAHGLNLEDELVKYLGGEIKFEIDHYGIDLIEQAATSADGALGTAGNGEWDATLGSGQEWHFTKYEFLDVIERASNGILNKTLRAVCTFMVCGNDVARVIKQMGEQGFKPAAGLDKKPATGPHVIGTLGGKTIIQDPFMTASRYVAGYKGDNYLMSGFIYAPYIPLFTTPTLITSDLMAQKGFLSSSGFKVINAGMYTFGTVANLPAG